MSKLKYISSRYDADIILKNESKVKILIVWYTGYIIKKDNLNDLSSCMFSDQGLNFTLLCMQKHAVFVEF